MAAGGFNWSGGWADLTHSGGTDIDGHALANGAQLTADSFSLDGKAGCEINVDAVEDNTGAITGYLYIYILRETEAGYETIDDEPWVIPLEVVQNGKRQVVFSIDPGQVGSHKILFDNDSGQELAITCQVRTATFDTA